MNQYFKLLCIYYKKKKEKYLKIKKNPKNSLEKNCARRVKNQILLQLNEKQKQKQKKYLKINSLKVFVVTNGCYNYPNPQTPQKK